MNRLTRWFVAFALVVGVVTAAQARITVPVSTDGFNRFTFQHPFNQMVLPPHTDLASKPVAMDGNKTLLLNFNDSVTEDVQMVIQLEDGTVLDFTLRPGADESADWTQPTKVSGDHSPHPGTSALIDLFNEVLAAPDKAPEGFHEQAVPNPGKINGLTADFTANYTNRNYQVLVMRLRAEEKGSIVPQDLYVKGVAAIYISGDTVGPELAPLAVVFKVK